MYWIKLFSFRFFMLTMICSFSLVASELIIEHALNVVLLPTNIIVSEEAKEINQLVNKAVKEANYEKSIEIVLIGLEKIPTDFSLQACFAALLGDFSFLFSGELKNKMEIKAKEIFDKLINEIEGQPKGEIYRFKNEYCFRFAKYKEQYENGKMMIDDYEQKENFREYACSGYYYQGVGAARYAKQLFIEENKEEALHYAQKAVIAWGQYFTYENIYYNSYVHYGLALGILGYEREMMNALRRSAYLIQRTLDYKEFQEIIVFFQEFCLGS